MDATGGPPAFAPQGHMPPPAPGHPQATTPLNMLATAMIARNLTLPEGLEEQPYYGQERAHTDDAPNDDAIRRRRRLRAKAPLPAGVTGAYRAHLLAQGRKGRVA